jgi:hypothetical protein
MVAVRHRRETQRTGIAPACSSDLDDPMTELLRVKRFMPGWIICPLRRDRPTLSIGRRLERLTTLRLMGK